LVELIWLSQTSGSASKSLVNDLLSTDIGRDVGCDYDEIVKEVAASAFWGAFKFLTSMYTGLII